MPVSDGNRLGRAHVGELVRHILVVAPHGGRFACTACRASPAIFSISTTAAYGVSAVRALCLYPTLPYLTLSAHIQVCIHPAKLVRQSTSWKDSQESAARGPDGCQNLHVQLANRPLCCQAKVTLDACAYVCGKSIRV